MKPTKPRRRRRQTELEKLETVQLKWELAYNQRAEEGFIEAHNRCKRRRTDYIV